MFEGEVGLRNALFFVLPVCESSTQLFQRLYLVLHVDSVSCVWIGQL